MDNQELICLRCGLTLIPKPAQLTYMGFNIKHDLPTCPKCGQIFISEELVLGRMKELEEDLEDK